MRPVKIGSSLCLLERCLRVVTLLDEGDAIVALVAVVVGWKRIQMCESFYL